MALTMPPMVWVVIIANILWIAIYLALFRIIDFESDYMVDMETTGDANA